MRRKSLKLGDACPAVAIVQAVLQSSRFFFDGASHIDGQFGEGTKKAVASFQEWAMSHNHVEGLKDDGEIGPKTIEAMRVHLNVDIANLADEYWPESELEDYVAPGEPRGY